MSTYDLLIRGAVCLLPDGSCEKRSIAVKDGRIAQVEPKGGPPLRAEREISAEGRSVLPGFVDTHTHPDKAMTRKILHNRSGTLSEAIGHFADFFPKTTTEDFLRRGRRMFELEASKGTSAVRAHVTVNELVDLRAFEAMVKLKEELKEIIEIQLVAFPGSPPSIAEGDRLYRLLVEALSKGADALGGCPNLAKDHRSLTNILLRLASEAKVPVDFHVDESDEPNVEALEYLAEAVLDGGFSSSVTAGHCTALAAVDDGTAARVIGKMSEAGIRVVTLPSCNLYLMGRGDSEPKRRGITRVHELLEAGVDVAYASDNIRDPFRPFGNGDMLEEGLLTAQLVQYGSDEQLKRILGMATYSAAKIFGYECYGITEGAPADLLLFDEADPVEVLISQSPFVEKLKRGRVYP